MKFPRATVKRSSQQRPRPFFTTAARDNDAASAPWEKSLGGTWSCSGRPVNFPFYMGVSENSVPLNPMVHDHYPVFKWLFHWEYTLFSDKPIYIYMVIGWWIVTPKTMIDELINSMKVTLELVTGMFTLGMVIGRSPTSLRWILEGFSPRVTCWLIPERV